MWSARTAKDEVDLLALFEASGHNVRRGAVLLRDLLDDFPESAELADAIVECEHEGDRIAHDILHRLAERGSRDVNLDPADVHALAGALDDVVDHAEEAADQLRLYGVEAPMEAAQQIARLLVGAADEVAAALGELRAGRDLAPRLVAVHRIENEADRVLRGALASLFANGIDPMIVIRWKDIFETLEAAVDACETVANVLEGICLKRASRRH